MKIKKRLFVLLSGLIYIFSGQNIYAASGDDAICSDYTGQAKGLCIAATKGLGCNTPESSANDTACNHIENQFEEATGEPVPWKCSAFTRDDIVNTWNSYQAPDGTSTVSYSSAVMCLSDSKAYFANIYFESTDGEWSDYALSVTFKGSLDGYYYNVENSTAIIDSGYINGSQMEACTNEIEKAAIILGVDMYEYHGSNKKCPLLIGQPIEQPK